MQENKSEPVNNVRPIHILLISACMALLMMALVWLLWGFYFEEYEAAFAALVYAVFNAPLIREWTTAGHFLLLPMLSGLSLTMPSVPVYGIWYLLLTFLWLTTAINFLIRLL